MYDDGNFISDSNKNNKDKQNLLFVYFDWKNYDNGDKKQAITINGNSIFLSYINYFVFDDNYYSLLPPDDSCGCIMTNVCNQEFIRFAPCSISNNQDLMLLLLHSPLLLLAPGIKNNITGNQLKGFDIFILLLHIVQEYFLSISSL